MVQANNTDLLIILLVNAQSFTSSHVCLDFGLAHDNSRCYIDITVGSTIKENVRSLCGVHVFTGSDYLLLSSKKGKKKALQDTNDIEEYHKVFSLFGEYCINTTN